MTVDGVSFSDEFVKGFKTEEDFLKEMEGEGYKHIYEGRGRKEALIKAYDLHHPKQAAEKAEAEKDSEKPKLQNAEAGSKKSTKA